MVSKENFFHPESEQKKSAQLALICLLEVLEEVEKGGTIDLSKQVSHPYYSGMNQKEAIEDMLGVLKANINLLDEKRRKTADGLIIKAELYLSAHKPKDKPEK
ncbi:MAG: hypothetical protein PHS62_03415 [Patescibacteria group bacterium]|nr:hypothetical protein [Patescibacteria group bacterium]